MDYDAREERSGKPGLYNERKKQLVYNKKSMIDNYRKHPDEGNNTCIMRKE
jgi:hypothetical protein